MLADISLPPCRQHDAVKRELSFGDEMIIVPLDQKSVTVDLTLPVEVVLCNVSRDGYRGGYVRRTYKRVEETSQIGHNTLNLKLRDVPEVVQNDPVQSVVEEAKENQEEERDDPDLPEDNESVETVSRTREDILKEIREERDGLQDDPEPEEYDGD